MAHHKRGRAKRTRAGCLDCKHWKMNGAPEWKHFGGGDLRRFRAAEEAVAEARGSSSDSSVVPEEDHGDE